jgi:hypothetical protein
VERHRARQERQGADVPAAQLALGAGLLFRRTARAALAGTIAWGLAVWWLGEGLGGILGSATSSPLTGAPGAAVLYALLVLLALAFWPVRRDSAAPVRDDGFLTG